MKLINKITIMLSIAFAAFTTSYAQIKNTKTETVKIYGNCEMCKKTIEKAGTIKNIAAVNWKEDTKLASITYDVTKTNQDEILKRVALAGYDSDKFLAPVDVYNNLPGCCQYNRVAKVAVKSENTSENNNSNEKPKVEVQETNQLKPVFDNYFAIKDALVGTNGNIASTKANELVASINAVKMDKLKMDVHLVWMKVWDDLKENAKHIADTKDTKNQRKHFMSLSKNMYQLMKISKTETPTYYQFCPMANDGKGANWLSKESVIKNPYYGTQMLSCGKTVETIK